MSFCSHHLRYLLAPPLRATPSWCELGKSYLVMLVGNTSRRLALRSVDEGGPALIEHPERQTPRSFREAVSESGRRLQVALDAAAQLGQLRLQRLGVRGAGQALEQRERFCVRRHL
jgi:hypothetical protein